MNIRAFFLLFLWFCFPSVSHAAITLVGSCSGTTSCTPPAHQAGDLFIGMAWRDGNNTAPTIPAGVSWTTLNNAAGSNTEGAAYAWKLAAGGSETTGTWTSATAMILLVYRGVDQTDPIGEESYVDGAGTNITIDGLVAFDITDGTSWAVACAGHRSSNTSWGEVGTAPTSMTLVVNASDGTDDAACYDTAGGVTSYAGDSVSVGGTSSGWRSAVWEIKAAAAATDTPYDPFGMSGFFGT